MTTPPPIQISREAMSAALRAALQRHIEWRQETADQVFTNTSAVVEATARAAVEAVAPLIAAQVLRAYADKEHPHAEGVTTQTNYGTGIEYDAVCAGCGASWNDDEGGCTERAALLAAAGGRERSRHEVDAEAWATGRLVHAEGCQINKTPPPGWPFDGFSCNCNGVEPGRSLTEDAP